MLKIRLGRFYRVENINKKTSANDHYNMIVVDNNLGELEELLFTDSDLTKAVVRKRKNKEDIPPYTIISDNGGFIYGFALLLTALVSGLIGYFINSLGFF